jgi:5S rRNA maturation endonuclease (ribonuclease M5)
VLTVVATPTERVREALEAYGHPVRNGAARCPAHEDRSPSLSVNEGNDGRAVINCHAGCEPGAVLAALGLTLADLFPDKTNGYHPKPEVVARYPYTDEHGEVLFTVERYEPGFDGARKSFAQRPANGKRGSGAMNGVRRVLYRLPQVLAAAKAGQTVFVVEGEKDVEALERAGQVATCNPAGAGKWSSVADAAWALEGAQVVIVADKDDAGLRHARDVVDDLRDSAASIIVVEAEHGKDAADHLASGFTVDDFAILAGAGGEPSIVDWLAVEVPEAPQTPSEASESDDEDTWAPIDLGPVLSGEIAQPVPDIMIRHDGSALIYEKAVNGIHGDSGAGKGWLVCEAIVRQAGRGYTSILLDYEDIAVSITARLTELGMTADEIVEHLIYIRPQTAASPAEVKRICDLITARDVRLVVIDSIGEAFAIEGIDENSDKEVGPWLRAVARPMAEVGAAVLLVDHSTKAADNPLYASGSKRKRAAITGSSFLVEAIEPFVKGKGGRLKLTCAKDRHGNYRRGDAAAYLVMEQKGHGPPSLTLYAPALTETKRDLPAMLCAKAAVKAAQKAGRTLSQAALIGLMDIKAGTETKRAGIDLAVGEGSLEESEGPRKARLFTFRADFDEAESDDV